MSQYQSFPGIPGDSKSFDKLAALRLPPLEGRRFLDVGCNEGFFCGFAAFSGAARSVGLDRSRECIARARQRFPDCEFHCHGWDALPDGPFDVILLASALHYADDQPALLHRLVERLDRDGVLVLELGLVASKKSEWVEVTRGIDKRWFPSLMKLREILAPYASKWKGRSVDQAGDPVPRHVVHISRRRPVAYLLMKPPGFGKTSLVNQLFAPAGIHVVSGDKQMVRLADGRLSVPQAMHELVAGDFSRYTIDDSIERVFKHGFGREWIATWLAAAGGGDFAMDGYVPADQHDRVRQYLVDAGYLPVTLDWDQPATPALDGRKLRRQAKAFYRAMAKREASTAANGQAASGNEASMEGYVDRIRLAGGRLIVEGWARNAHGKVPEVIVVRLNDRLLTCSDFDVVSRPDVAKHVGTSDDRLGFRIELDADGMKTPSDLGSEFSVAPLGGSAFRLTPRAAKLLGRR
jgi:SAM-dependent methyltransferase